ncbi:MAG: PAS domain-containing protein [Methanomicrobiales archaeon]|nr:PAS domain-containing protein [Methanomicrobiales archaeon]
MNTPPSPDRQWPFSHYLLVSMVLIILLVASGITVIDYLQAKENYDRNAAFLQEQTEKDIVQSIRIIDAGFRLFDDSQNEKMIDRFSYFMAEYERAGRNPAKMDLTRLKEERMGEFVELYIINESNVIQYSTFSPDLEMDFRTVPYFSQYLDEIRQSDGYFSDRVVTDSTGQLRKFAYMPTPDHRYIFEIGLSGPLYEKQHSFQAYQENIDQIAYINPFVKDVMIYDITKKPFNPTTPLPDRATEEILEQVISDRAGREILDPSGFTKTKYLFVDLADTSHGSDVSQIVRITYDTSRIRHQLNDLLVSHFITAVLAVLIGIVAAILLSRALAFPIFLIVSDVNRIAKGDLLHKIAPTRGREFAILEDSVNTMVTTLNATIARERQSEARYRQLIENVPDVLWTSTKTARTVFISRNVEKVYGFTPEEIYEQGVGLLFDRIHPDDRNQARAAWESFFSKKSFDVEYRIQRKDGTWIWLHDRSTSVYERDGEWFADGIFSDITERKQTEEKLHRFYAELEQRVIQRTAELQKTEEAFRQANKKLNLLSSITRHDILNQLTILTGYMKLAGERIADPDGKKYLATAQKAAEVINRHMVFTRLYQNVGIQAPAWQSISRIMQKVRADLPGDRITCSVETGELELYADPLLEKVFFTLLENTFRHSERATEVRITYSLTDSGLFLVYEDNGIGVAPHEKEQIFEWGYGKHTGFGLFLSREILAITGLSIRENGEPGKGVRFEIHVPPNAYRISQPPGSDT